MNPCYLTIQPCIDIDPNDCPPALLPKLFDPGDGSWSGWCRCGWSMPGPAFDAEDVANAWGDHLQPDMEPRILFAG